MSATPSGSLRRNAAWVFLGQGFYLGCQWLLLLIFARLGGADDAGLFALGLAVCAPVMVLANLHLRELQASDAREEFRFQERLAVRLGAVAIALGAIIATALIVGWSHRQALVIAAVGAAKTIEAIADLGYGALQARERFIAISLAQGLRGLVGLTAATTTFLLTGEVHLALFMLAAAWLVMVVIFDLPRVAGVIAPAAITPEISRPRLVALLRQALPMGVVGGIGTVTLMFPSYLIQHHLGSEPLGHYTGVLYLLLIGNLATLALGQAASPRLGRAFADGDRSGFMAMVARLLLSVAGLGVLAVAGAWLIGGSVLALLYGETWRDQASLLTWLAGAAAVQWLASALGFASTAARRLTIQVPIAVMACAVSGLTSWWFIPVAGLIGAAWSGMVTCMVLVACYAVLILRARPGTMSR